MEEKVLIVTIAPKPVAQLVIAGARKVQIGGKVFEEIGAGDTNGFYDFLRDRDGNILGVKYSPFLGLSYLCDSAVSGDGMRVINPHTSKASLELFWGSAASYDPVLSEDQFFDYNYVFSAADGSFAVTFGFSYLSEMEINNIAAVVAMGRDTTTGP
jgi:hypothetical protein